jgi:LysR family transcriptional regulator, hydrogen peroxide-inducible genes activator
MNIRDLKYLVAIADHKHFGKAAEACFVSQPALSMQIKKLENLLGVQLIERTTKSAWLTAIGETITEHAREVLYRAEVLKETAKQAKNPFGGELRLGIIPTLGPYLLPKIIPGLTKAFPQLILYLVEEKTETLISRLRQNKLDGALLGFPQNETGLSDLPLFKEEFMLVVPSTHPFAKFKTVKMADLENKDILLLEEGHCMRDLALEFCNKSRAREVQALQATSLETLRYMILAKSGITLLPKLACQESDGLSYLTFTNPKPSRDIGLCWRSSSAKKILFEKLAEQIRKIMAAEHSSVLSYSQAR